MRPLVTILMPVFNCGTYLDEAIKSMLDQSFGDFILYIINDGSTDDSKKIIDYYAKKDKRILVSHQENIGLIGTLNLMISNVDTKYIARMDGDDVSDPERLKLQIEFLEKNCDIGILGTGIRFMDTTLKHRIYDCYFPTDSVITIWKMCYTTGVGHATVVMRTELFSKIGKYAEAATFVEDYDFFLRASTVTKIVSLPRPLYLYRNQPESVSNLNKAEQKQKHFDLSKQVLRSYVDDLTDDSIRFLKYGEIEKGPSAVHIYGSLMKLFANFCARNRPAQLEKKIIRHDLSIKLLGVALAVFKGTPVIGIFYLLRVFFFNPRLILSQFFLKRYA